MYKVWLIGYPGNMGGANTECWHTIKLWRECGVEVHLLPTWAPDPKYKPLCDSIGCITHHAPDQDPTQIPELHNQITVGMCNSHYMAWAGPLRNQLNCPIVWVNCMTFLFPHETRFIREYGIPDALIYQSHFQRSLIERHLTLYHIPSESLQSNSFNIHGAFDFSDPIWSYRPRPHAPNTSFIIGRASRPDADKWSHRTWHIYSQIHNRQALVLGYDGTTRRKAGIPPAEWAVALPPQSMDTHWFWRSLHCCIPINGGARENWPRVGLECFAVGVPLVVPDDWGWKEFVDHGTTGYRAQDESEIVHWANELEANESLRLQLTEAARHKLVTSHANPDILWSQWKEVFDKCQNRSPTATSTCPSV